LALSLSRLFLFSLSLPLSLFLSPRLALSPFMEAAEFPDLLRAGTIGAVSLCVATIPLDVVRHAVQAAISSKRPHPGLTEAFRAAASPPSGFFRGLVPALFCSAAGPAAFLLGYEVQRGSKEVLEAGLVAKAVQVAVVQPFDFFRTSWQAALLLPETRASHLLRGPWEVITTDGPRSLWRGLIPTLLRDVFAAGTFWSSYMYLNQVMLNDSSMEEFDAAAMRQRAVQSAFVSSVCAMGAAIVTQPMDMVKTKMQIHRMMTSRDDGFRRVKAKDARAVICAKVNL